MDKEHWIARWQEIAEQDPPDWYTANPMMSVYDYIEQQGFPTVAELRNGILLGCISHALWLAANDAMFEHEKDWDGTTFLADNGQGERWAVDFAEGGAVAVFYTNETERNPYPEGSPPYDQNRYFIGMPARLQSARERALRWMPDLEWMTGGPNGVITAAMWADGERFTAAEEWAGVFRHSLWVCYAELLPYEVALLEWQDEAPFDDDQMAVMLSLYERKLASPDAPIQVEPWERTVMLGSARTYSPRDAGIAAAARLLAAVGINLFESPGA